MIGWYKRDPSAALEGMQGLSLEERGAYNTVLDLIYIRDDRLPDDARFISGYLGVDIRIWKRIKTSLMVKGKLVIEDGYIRNKRASNEVATRVARAVANSVAGHYSALARAEKSEANVNENKDLNGTGVEHALNHAGAIKSKSKSKSKKEEPCSPFEIPDWVPRDAWDGWLEMRARNRIPTTDRAMTVAVNKMTALRKGGHDPGKLLDHATVNNWKGIWPGKNGETLSKAKQAEFNI